MGATRVTLEQRAWTLGYVAALLTPFALMAIAPWKEGVWNTFAIGLGFVAFAGMSLQVVLAARVPTVSRSIGIGSLTRMHRHMGSALVLLVVAHVVVLAITNPWSLHWLWPVGGPLVAWAGTLAALAMLGIGVTSVWRARLRLDYERWRLVHSVLTAVAIIGAYVHVLLASAFSFTGPVRWYATALVLVAGVAFVYLRVGRAFGALARPLVVVEVRAERGDATTLVLRPADNAPITAEPGAMAWLKFHGRPYAATEHPFSIASAGGTSDTLEVTIKAIGDTTRALRELPLGTDVLVDGPHGGVHGAPGTRGWVLAVAGIGVTPAMSVLRTAVSVGADEPIQLLYGVRTWGDATFREELTELAAAGALELHVTESDVAADEVFAAPPAPGITRHHGWIDAALLGRVLPVDSAQRSALVCGPAGFGDAITEALVAHGLPAGAVHTERFGGV